MASRDSIVRDLLEKLRNAPNEELSEVADFAEFLHAQRLKRTAVAPSSPSLDELQARAACGESRSTTMFDVCRENDCATSEKPPASARPISPRQQ